MLCGGESNTTYTTLVRTLLGLSSAAWDPNLAKDVDQLECVQRRAARFVMNDYRRTTSVISLLNQLEWSPLPVRRRNSRLVAFYKAVNNLSPVPVGQPRPCSYQTRSYDPLTFTPLTHQPTTTSILSYRAPLSIGIRCHSHYEPSRRLIHSVQVSSTSLSPGHLTEQNDNTPAVTGYAHCWIFHRSTEENKVGSRRSKFKVTRGRRVIGGPGGDIILESSRFSSFLVSSANN